MKKKYGPLPLWAWGAVGVVAIYLWYRYTQASSTSTTSTSTAASNTGIDPITGVPYSEEESAFQNEAASALAPGSGGSYNGTTATGAPDLGQEIGDVTGLITSLQTSGLIPGPGTVTSGSSGTSDSGGSSTSTGAGGGTPAAPPTVSTRMSTGNLLNVKAILAPFGSTAPPAKSGYTAVGTGNGNWQYVPNDLVNVAHGYIYGSISHNAPTAPKGYTAKGLGQGLWEIIPTPKPAGSRS